MKSPVMPKDTAPRFRYSLLLKEIDRLRASNADTPLALILGQIDGLRKLNAKLGYVAGDTMLDEFFTRVRTVAREQDIAFELSGNSFALIVHNPQHAAHAALAAQKITRLAAEPFEVGSVSARLDLHMGVSLSPDPARTSEELVWQAELALSIACDRGEDHLIYEAALENDTGTASQGMFDAHQAISNGEFRVHFQPKIWLRSGQLAGAESLLRWQSPDRGLIPPGGFLSEVEQARAMAPLLHYVLNTSLREASRWAQKIPRLSVAVNASASNLDDADLGDIVTDVLAMWAVDPGNLTIEVTETALMRDPEAGISVLEGLRRQGVRISIDDFGTGYSSLAYIKDLPADEIKIDRSFVQSILSDDTDRQIVQSLIQLAHAVDLKVVAEGIETAEIAGALASLGCDVGQGFHFGRPATAASFESKWVPQLENDTASVPHLRVVETD